MDWDTTAGMEIRMYGLPANGDNRRMNTPNGWNVGGTVAKMAGCLSKVIGGSSGGNLMCYLWLPTPVNRAVAARTLHNSLL